VCVPVDDVHVHLQPRAKHSDRICDTIVTVHQKMLADSVNHRVLGGQIDGLRVFNDVLNIVVGNFAVGGNHRMHAAIVKAADMPAGHAEINAADFHVGHLLGLDDGVTHTFFS